jgi:DNA invertase Pin-like site-specific DNA recombinase
MNATKYVSYIRVSTTEQGESGLGLEAQRKAVSDYLARESCELIGEFVEVESGSRNDRAQLLAAIELCKGKKATLLIAKLDRLARNVAFISTLMESGLDFVAVDNPHANKLMIRMLAAFAEHERDEIRARTEAALAAAKARGVVLGRYGREVLSKKNHAKAIERARELAPTVIALWAQRLTVLQICEVMNQREIPSAQGRRWHPATVHALIRRVRKYWEWPSIGLKTLCSKPRPAQSVADFDGDIIFFPPLVSSMTASR